MTRPLLTPDQREILLRAADVMTRAPRYVPTSIELGDELGISHHTVKNHLRNIYDRLQAAGLIDTVHPDISVAILAAVAAGEIRVPRLRAPSRRRRTTEQAESLELV